MDIQKVTIPVLSEHPVVAQKSVMPMDVRAVKTSVVFGNVSKDRLVDFSKMPALSSTKEEEREILYREYHVETDPKRVVAKLREEAKDARNQGEQDHNGATFEAQMKVLWGQKEVEDGKTLLTRMTNAAVSGGILLSRMLFGLPRELPRQRTEFEAMVHARSNTSEEWTAVGMAEAQGRRAEMEDAHRVTVFTFRSGGRDVEVKLAATFDGHSGDQCSLFAASEIETYLRARLEQYNVDGLTDAGIWNACKLALVDLSRAYSGMAGSTANIALMIEGNLWLVNLGDSRAVLVDPLGNVVQLSEDAKPNIAKYKQTIANRGGVVLHVGVWRVDGGLAVARSLGDHQFEGHVSARPKIVKIERPMDGWAGYFLIQCCDGVFDVATSAQVGTLVHRLAQHGYTPEQMAKEIVVCAYDALSMDNLSSSVIRL